jgi:hypothetical protein
MASGSGATAVSRESFYPLMNYMMQKLASPADLHAELKDVLAVNQRGASRDELATMLGKLASRVAGPQRVSLHDAFQTLQAAKASVLDTLEAIKSAGDTSGEYQQMQKVLDYVIESQTNLDSAMKLAKRYGYI